MYIRSKIDYGAFIYQSASTTLLKTLESVSNEAMRIATGAFRSSPAESLRVLVNEMSLEDRRSYLVLRYYYRIRGTPSNPAFNMITDSTDELLFRNTRTSPPLSIQVNQMLQKYNISPTFIKPEFSFRLQDPQLIDYPLKIIRINLELTEYPKSTTSDIIFLQLFGAIMSTKYANFYPIYTDGSRNDRGAGAAAVHNGGAESATLPECASVFSTEIYAIKMALSLIPDSDHSKFIIFSDSLSSLKALQNLKNTHPYVQEVIHRVNFLTRQKKQIELCWIPSHIGIPGNQRADEKAKLAASREPQLIPLFYRDLYPTIAKAIKDSRDATWQQSPQKLRMIKDRCEYWPPHPNLTRREEVVMNRLRIGHSFLTHSYLMNSERVEGPPTCPNCEDVLLTIEHIIVDCPALETQRRIFGSNHQTTMKILDQYCDPKKIISYLNGTNFLSSI